MLGEHIWLKRLSSSDPAVATKQETIHRDKHLVGRWKDSTWHSQNRHEIGRRIILQNYVSERSQKVTLNVN